MAWEWILLCIKRLKYGTMHGWRQGHSEANGILTVSFGIYVICYIYKHIDGFSVVN
jgi:hypothetical protein